MKQETTLTAGETALREGLRIWAEVDLDAIEANVRALCERAGEAKLLAVVKGNAYGHGAIAVAQAAVAAGAWGLGVISVDEGEYLRAAGIEAPLLVLGPSAPVLARRLVAADLRVTVGSIELGQALSDAARAAGRTARVHVKVETGLNRFGLQPDEAVALAEALRALAAVEVEGLATHLASVDEGDKTFTHAQHEAFHRSAQRLDWVPLHHVSSTGGLLDLPNLRLGMVRAGIGVYGYYPSDEVSHDLALR
ncbi:MAG TPA: alanine racemase, partial [Dehalococcoidia bacterium]|nr:alanine racemase [Dehalococcoidia bacterium]